MTDPAPPLLAPTVEDISALPPEELLQRFQEIASRALLCRRIIPLEANAEGGLAVGLECESGGRADVRDLERVLDTDRLVRISYLIGIFKALNILYCKKLADAWMQLPNTNRIFGGQTPLAYMMKGGLPAMQTVRRLLDARRGGV